MAVRPEKRYPMSLTFTHPLALWALALVLPALLVPLLARGRAWRETPGRTWWSLALRLLIALALLFGLAGAQLVRSVGELTVVYVLDLSDSVPAAERQRAEELVRASVQDMPPGDRAAVVAFGQNALVERLASEARRSAAHRFGAGRRPHRHRRRAAAGPGAVP